MILLVILITVLLTGSICGLASYALSAKEQHPKELDYDKRWENTGYVQMIHTTRRLEAEAGIVETECECSSHKHFTPSVNKPNEIRSRRPQPNLPDPGRYSERDRIHRENSNTREYLEHIKYLNNQMALAGHTVPKARYIKQGASVAVETYDPAVKCKMCGATCFSTNLVYGNNVCEPCFKYAVKNYAKTIPLNWDSSLIGTEIGYK